MGKCCGRTPPFEDIKKVLTKACLEPCKMILVTPMWKGANWVPLLVKIAVRQLEIPPGVPVFERSLGKGLLPGRHWGVKVSLVETFANKVEEGELDPLLIQELEMEAQNRGPEKLLEEMEFHRHRGKQEEPRKIPRRVVIDRVCREGE